MNYPKAPVFVSQEDVTSTPMSNWYQFTLGCGHQVLSRVRLSFRASFNQHFVRCPKTHKEVLPLGWVPLESIEAVTDEFVRNVLDGSSFIVPRRILRTDGSGTSTGTPFPYITRDSDI